MQKEHLCSLDVLYNLTKINPDGSRPWRPYPHAQNVPKAVAIRAADDLCYDQDAAVHVWQNGTCIHTAYPRGFKLNP